MGAAESDLAVGDGMTRREELDAEIARLQTERDKLDATPWEERNRFDGDKFRVGSTGEIEVYAPHSPCSHAGWYPPALYMLESVATYASAQSQLIACVRALRRMVRIQRENWPSKMPLGEVGRLNDEAFGDAAKALEELDAL